MPSAWDDRADKHLLLAIIEEGTIKSINWQNVADTLAHKGFTFTREACRQHFQKLRREIRGNSTANTPTRSSKATPSKRGTGTSSGKAKTKFAGNDHEDDDDEEAPYPLTPKYQNLASGSGSASASASKKRKVEKMEGESKDWVYGVQNATIFKMENAEEETGVVDLERDDLYSGYDYV